jgi:CubicO group peptidase (beta-lactamase class C family)
MRETRFLPSRELRPRIAPTEFREQTKVMIHGEVHDPRAYRLGGVAGNAGLFSTARDLARYARMLLGNGSLDGVKILSPEAMAQMTAPHDVPGGIRALGWDVQSRYSLNRGTRLSRRAFGHGGYTGTALWVDPEQDLFLIFLSNRVHPDGKGSVNQLAGDISDTVSSQLAPVPAPALGASPAPTSKSEPAPAPKLGIDVLVAENFARLRGARVAVLTNDTAQSASGTRSLDALAGAPGVTLAAVFTPEHGQAANKDEAIPDAVDERWGVPVYSL